MSRLMTKFLGIEPTLEDYWRSLILFGHNVACYKFALAKALIEIAPSGKTVITLGELAVPYVKQITEHLKKADKQITSPSSQFLESCRRFNRGELEQDELIDMAVRRGFENVLDAFHNLRSGEIPRSFFNREQWKSAKQITLTDELLQLVANENFMNLEQETEARWRLVETSWSLNISRNLIAVNYDPVEEILFTQSNRRVDITSCRDALNGYQKGKCFYCFKPISLESSSPDFTEVDHFFPHVLREYIKPINGVWNLVLACVPCNRGINGKSDSLPDLTYLERLHTRNKFLISSHHPLRETLIQQTGSSEKARVIFLQTNYNEAQRLLGVGKNQGWRTPQIGFGF